MDSNDEEPIMVWVDLEMTGLNPVDDMILEMGFRITNWDGSDEVARFTTLVYNTGWRERLNLGDNRPALEIHQSNGLIADLEGAGSDDAPSPREAESMALSWLASNDVPHGLSLAGSSNSLDRWFLLRHMPELAGWFGYRVQDMSSIREIMRTTNPELETRYQQWSEGKIDAHRPQPDIDASIDQYQWLIDNYLMV